MPTLLHIDSSANLEHSRSRAITATFADTWASLSPDHVVVRRDLHRDQLPHLADYSLHWPAAGRPADAHAPVEGERLQHDILDELLAADVVVIGCPLYNYSMPSTLKAWVDYIHVPGLTAFPDAADQPMHGRTAILVGARGVDYDEGTGRETWDHALPPLELVLGTSLGMQIEVVTTSLTLAEQVPDLAPQIERSRSELAAAHEAAAAIARRVGGAES